MSQQINLFNSGFLKQKAVFTAVPMVEAFGAILVGVLALNWYAGQRLAELQQVADAGKATLAKREVRLTDAATQFAPRQRSAALAAEVAQAEVELKSLHDVEAVLHGGALGNTDGYAEYFRAFSRQNVGGLWLTGVTIVGAGNDIGVQGRAMQATLIPNYIARLTAERIMHGKTFSSLDISRPETDAMATVAPAPEAISPQLAAMAGIVSEPKAGGKAGAASPAAPAPAAAPAAAVRGVAPYVEFSLQSNEQQEAAK